MLLFRHPLVVKDIFDQWNRQRYYVFTQSVLQCDSISYSID